MGYHGSAIENFHSILHNGLDDTFGRSTSIYGDGVYLSEDRDVGYSFVKAGKVALGGRTSPLFGEQFGLLACASVSKHPQVRHSHTASGAGAAQRYRDAAILVDGQRQLPPGYIVVTSPQHILIRYVLVYTNNASSAAIAAGGQRRVNICQYMFVFYILLLVLLAYYKYRNSVSFIMFKHSLGL